MELIDFDEPLFISRVAAAAAVDPGAVSVSVSAGSIQVAVVVVSLEASISQVLRNNLGNNAETATLALGVNVTQIEPIEEQRVALPLGTNVSLLTEDPLELSRIVSHELELSSSVAPHSTSQSDWLVPAILLPLLLVLTCGVVLTQRRCRVLTCMLIRDRESLLGQKPKIWLASASSAARSARSKLKMSRSTPRVASVQMIKVGEDEGGGDGDGERENAIETMDASAAANPHATGLTENPAAWVERPLAAARV